MPISRVPLPLDLEASSRCGLLAEVLVFVVGAVRELWPLFSGFSCREEQPMAWASGSTTMPRKFLKCAPEHDEAGGCGGLKGELELVQGGTDCAGGALTCVCASGCEDAS